MDSRPAPARLDSALLRAYPYPGEEAARMTAWLLANCRDAQGRVREDSIPRMRDKARMQMMLRDPYSPWRLARRGVLTHNSAYVDTGEQWTRSDARWDVISALAELPNVHGTPGGYPVRRPKAFTEEHMSKGAKGEDLTALALARYAEGLPVLNSVKWPWSPRFDAASYDFDHIVTAGNRVAIVDAKFSSRIQGNTVRLVGSREVPGEDKRAWEQWRRDNGRKDARWTDVWDALYFNDKIHSTAPVDGAVKLRSQFEQMGRHDIEVKVFTAFNMDASGQLHFTVEGNPVSAAGEVRHMALEAVRWVRMAGNKADPAVVSYLHSRLKGVEETDPLTGVVREGSIECVGNGCAYTSRAAA